MVWRVTRLSKSAFCAAVARAVASGAVDRGIVMGGSGQGEQLAANAVRGLLARAPGLDPARVDDVVFGCANGAGEDNRDVARMAVLLAGLPTSVVRSGAWPIVPSTSS